jgi:hypothetical protein
MGSDQPSDDDVGANGEPEEEFSDGEVDKLRDNLGTTTRRTVMAGLAGAGLLGLGTGSAAADADGEGPAVTTLAEGDTLTAGGVFSVTDGSNNVGLQLDAQGSTQYGLIATTDKNNGRALQGKAQSNGFNVGVDGVSASPDGKGVQGFAFNSDADAANRGVIGKAAGGKGRGVEGKAEASSGFTYGVYGTTNSPDGNGVFGSSAPTSGNTIGVRGRTNSTEGTGVKGEAVQGSGVNYGVVGTTNSPDGFGLYTPDDVKIDGDLQVEGKKHFVQAVEAPSGTKEVTYTAVESGKVRTEDSGVVDLEDGTGVIDLPEHFQLVTSEEEPLTIQLTPYADERVHPQVVDRSLERIEIKDFGDGSGDYTVSYTVKGVREGFEDDSIVSDPE